MNTKTSLDNTYYEDGKQLTNFRSCYTFIDKQTKELGFSKWIRYLDLQRLEDWKINNMNQREQLHNEIILDLDEGTIEDYYNLLMKLEEDGMRFKAYATKQGRARHIHTLWNVSLAQMSSFQRRNFRNKIIGKYKCDMQLSTDAHMIPIEHQPHWKTGLMKKLIYTVEGRNNVEAW